MTQSAPSNAARTPGTICGIPFGDFGWFASLLIGVAAGFAAFFATTFFAIVSMLVYISVTHQPVGSVNFALTYRRAGFPVGVIVMALSLAYLGTLWARRHLRRS